jgi:flagella basal body P-ring formation protein FlgA
MENNIETVAIVALILLVIGLVVISLRINYENQKLEEEVQGQSHLANIYKKEGEERLLQLSELRVDLITKQKKIAHLEQFVVELTKTEEKATEIPVEITKAEFRAESPAIPSSRNKRKKK